MAQQFVIDAWTAFAPGITSQQAWLQWAAAPSLPAGDAVPALSEMPALQRRRLEGLGRMALQVAYWCQPEGDAETPLIFASRHGDLARTYQMLDGLADNQPLSPTQFGLSTHNAIAAQFAIATGFTGNYSAVSAGRCTPEAAITEAIALLADGARQVLVIQYDLPLPEAYARFADEPPAPYAWAVRLAAADGRRPSYSLQAGPPSAENAATPSLPHGLDVLRFLLAKPAPWSVSVSDGGRGWLWQCHD